MTTMTINDGNNANAAAANAGAAAHHQSNKDIEARLAGVEALLDQSARTIKTLHAAVVLSAGRPPVQTELDLATEARETLAAVARALPPKALLGGGVGEGGGGGGEGDDTGDKDRLARLATVEKTVRNLGILPPPVHVVVAGAGAGTAAAAATQQQRQQPAPSAPPPQQQ